MNKNLGKQGILRLWLLQLGITSILATVCAIMYGVNAAISAILGGLVCIIPNAYFAYILFKHQGARAAKQIVNGFYKGEAVKMFLSMFLFTAVFVFYRVTPLAFFVSYITVLMTHWFAPWIISTNLNRQNK